MNCGTIRKVEKLAHTLAPAGGDPGHCPVRINDPEN